MGDVLDKAKIADIVGDVHADPVAVNRQITGTYHRLSDEMRKALGTEDDLDWCGFAKWSSSTVGLDIDPMKVGSRVANLSNLLEIPGLASTFPPLDKKIRQATVAALQHIAAAKDDLARRSLRAGNVTIFSEMGTAYVRLLDRLAGPPDGVPDEEFAANVAAAILGAQGRRLPAPFSREHLVEIDGAPLAQALMCYLRAAREPDHRRELILAGNVLFSLFEQARADRIIAIGLCTPTRAKLIPAHNFVPFVGDIDVESGMLAGPEHPHPLIRHVDWRVVETLTDLALVVKVGVGADMQQVRLGHPDDLPPPPFVPILPEVVAVLDEQRNRAAGVGRNWLDLRYRMSVIARYFAAYQQKPEARRPPPDIG